MRMLSTLMAVGLLVVAGCGGDDEPRDAGAGPPAATTMADGAGEVAAAPAAKTARRGTTITVRRSPFGRMLFGSDGQAIYIFERDRKGRTVCYGECAQAWPPVFTSGRPVAGKGVRAALLGTVKRRGGRRQVTYAGRPLYFYAHEGPGEVRCHDVNLNGGFWWAVGPDGTRRP